MPALWPRARRPTWCCWMTASLLRWMPARFIRGRTTAPLKAVNSRAGRARLLLAASWSSRAASLLTDEKDWHRQPMGMSLTTALAALAIGYFLGAIPFGLLFGFLSGAGDIRKMGSGNIGATNVLRTGKKWAAVATLLCDAAKGAAAVLLARYFLAPGAEIFAALAAILGHMFPVWLGFKGGKGGATGL